MAEKLVKIGHVLGGLGDALKTMKTIRQKELYRVTEEAKKYAEMVNSIDLPGDSKLEELKKVLTEVIFSSAKLESELENFRREIIEFDKFLRDNIKDSSIPPKVIEQLSEKLTKMHTISQSFSIAFSNLASNLESAQQLATVLEAQERQRAEAKNREADKNRNKAVAGGVASIAGGVGIGICAVLGFFTGGAGWVAGAAIAGAAAGAALAVKSGLDVKEMRQQARKIVSGAEKLGVLAKSLKSNSDKAGQIELDKEAMEALETALEFFKEDLNKDELIEQLQSKLQDKDERIAELKRKLKSVGLKRK